jgi:hypothetical protein
MIRGAVAFGLVLRIDDEVKNKPVIVTTSLSLVVFTTVVFGSTVSTLQKLLFGKEMAEKKRLDDIKKENAHKNDGVDRSSEHLVFEHPNFDIEEVNPTTPKEQLIS